jgi:hypothetical protein
MNRLLPTLILATLAGAAMTLLGAEKKTRPLDVVPKPIAKDKSVKYDYDIVYVRAPRFVKGHGGKDRVSAWPEIAHPTNIDPGYDLMLLHPDGTEEVLVKAGKGSIADPYVSFDGKWVYYTLFHDPARGHWTAGADIYKIHVPSRKTVRLTQQEYTPNTAVAPWSNGKVGVYNMQPCPLPGGRIAFVSNRDGVKTPRGSPRFALQLYVMDDDGRNIEKIGHLNVAGALHPVVLKDGRIIFSSLESQGMRGGIQWGIWSIHPDGTNWEPVVSAFLGGGASNAFHFQTQLSDGSIVVELYYNQNTAGFGSLFKLPPRPPEGQPAFHPADPRAHPTPDKLYQRGGPLMGSGPLRHPFLPVGMEAITRFTSPNDEATSLSDPSDKNSPRLGKFAHPCGAPDNHLLTLWTPGAGPSAAGFLGGPPTDAGIYLIKEGKAINEPAEMLLIKNDPKYNEQWPRPLVPYSRIYGVKEPKKLLPLVNDGKRSPHLPEGTPFGLVGSSSLYKRESFPNGRVEKGSVTATGHPYASFGLNSWIGTNWGGQGADAGLYANSDIHAIRILAMEPATEGVAQRFYNRARERLRILGEIPVRKISKDGKQPLDPDGNPDTSFLAKIPADVAFTFQTLDKDGMVLNMAQTWHQVRPGEIRNNCGGCHAHSQKPTLFEDTAAARKDYVPFDLTKHTPLLTTKANDQSGRKWDKADTTGLRFEKTVKDVEYYRDVRPILERSCLACHSHKAEKPAGGVVLDPDKDLQGAASFMARFNNENHAIAMSGLKSVKGRIAFMQNPYLVRDFQSRRSLLIWKVFGRRLDGLPAKPAKGMEQDHKLVLAAGDFKGSIMPPPEAVKSGKVKPLSDEDRRTLVRWIDLGCPIDWAYDPTHPEKRGNGWMLDDQRPTLTLTSPRAGTNDPLARLVVGMHDYNTGLDMGTFSVVADFPVEGTPAGEDLAKKFRSTAPGVWQLELPRPITTLAAGKLTVAVKDRQGNLTRIERTFSIGAKQK